MLPTLGILSVIQVDRFLDLRVEVPRVRETCVLETRVLEGKETQFSSSTLRVLHRTIDRILKALDLHLSLFLLHPSFISSLISSANALPGLPLRHTTLVIPPSQLHIHNHKKKKILRKPRPTAKVVPTSEDLNSQFFGSFFRS